MIFDALLSILNCNVSPALERRFWTIYKLVQNADTPIDGF